VEVSRSFHHEGVQQALRMPFPYAILMLAVTSSSGDPFGHLTKLFQGDFSRLNPLRFGQNHCEYSIFYPSSDFIRVNRRI